MSSPSQASFDSLPVRSAACRGAAENAVTTGFYGDSSALLLPKKCLRASVKAIVKNRAAMSRGGRLDVHVWIEANVMPIQGGRPAQGRH
ncbi:hypothetical protein SAMN02800691_1693 [Luteibacter sp. UNCMF366Tsu5.1]|nr:hypothetical protein SAMN02800691_1693 [Luteibacter sp. UNCMF366Tsu5.1]